MILCVITVHPFKNWHNSTLAVRGKIGSVTEQLSPNPAECHLNPVLNSGTS